ncbi:stage V sporulation protein AA [Neobacillus notoginsengisoli]|uniref:Stage V sporulation protein AA n=1 Tax=Neobacillus notoginsengisoli TaxID=1578198 RepID=A0A417YV86_9BACI|nr:stage V sporulation protein AA [Neobacillus notoginsengisoli]RHW41190.1 stage V sporulation protein AA [Neobacillus notoginsengisoli]
MEKTVYIRMRNRILVQPGQDLSIGDIAQVLAPESLVAAIKKMDIYQVTQKDSNFVVIDAMKVIKKITGAFPDADIQAVGPAQTLIEVVVKNRKRLSFSFFILIWLLLFFGSAMAIMNFHDDVSMKSVQSKLYTIITGEKSEKPLLFQIPYSLGLGVGMVLFFNHIFKKRINEEPSPLEVEMFNYQQALDSYVILHENKESMKRLDND